MLSVIGVFGVTFTTTRITRRETGFGGVSPPCPVYRQDTQGSNGLTMSELYQIVDESGKLTRTLPDGQIVSSSISELTNGRVRSFALGRVTMRDGSQGRSIRPLEQVTVVHITDGQTYLFRSGQSQQFNDPAYVRGQPVVMYTANVALPNGETIPLAETIAAVRPVGQIVYSNPTKSGAARYIKVTPEIDASTGTVINAPVGLALAPPEELIRNAIAGHIIKHAKQQIIAQFHSPANIEGVQFETFYDLALYLAGQLANTIVSGVMEEL